MLESLGRVDFCVADNSMYHLNLRLMYQAVQSWFIEA